MPHVFKKLGLGYTNAFILSIANDGNPIKVDEGIFNSVRIMLGEIVE